MFPPLVYSSALLGYLERYPQVNQSGQEQRHLLEAEVHFKNNITFFGNLCFFT